MKEYYYKELEFTFDNGHKCKGTIVPWTRDSLSFFSILSNDIICHGGNEYVESFSSYKYAYTLNPYKDCDFPLDLYGNFVTNIKILD